MNLTVKLIAFTDAALVAHLLWYVCVTMVYFVMMSEEEMQTLHIQRTALKRVLAGTLGIGLQLLVVRQAVEHMGTNVDAEMSAFDSLPPPPPPPIQQSSSSSPTQSTKKLKSSASKKITTLHTKIDRAVTLKNIAIQRNALYAYMTRKNIAIQRNALYAYMTRRLSFGLFALAYYGCLNLVLKTNLTLLIVLYSFYHLCVCCACGVSLYLLQTT